MAEYPSFARKRLPVAHTLSWAFKKMDSAPLDANGGACDLSQASWHLLSFWPLMGPVNSLHGLRCGEEPGTEVSDALRGMQNEQSTELPTLVLMKDLHEANPREVLLSGERETGVT